MWEIVQTSHESETNEHELVIESVHKVDGSVRKVDARKARIRWFVAVTLINNPGLVELRKREMPQPEKEKGPCPIKQFTTKVARKIETIRENCQQKHDTEF